MRVPFDSLALCAVVRELQDYVGGKVQRIVQADETQVGISLYSRGAEGHLLLSCHPVFFRAGLTARRSPNRPEPLGFVQALRARFEDGRIDFIRQVRFDRVLEIGVDGPEGPHILLAELMGKHSNLILVDGKGIVVSVAKPVGPGKSVRPVLPGRLYAPPPFPILPPVFEAKPEDDLANFEGSSPFLRRLVQAAGQGLLADIRRRLDSGEWEAWLSEGHGAYPLSLAPLGLPQWERKSFSSALEQHYARWIEESEVESARQALRTQLERVRLAREAAIADLRQAADAAARARELQERAELILAYGPSAPSGASLLEAWDYQGNPVQIRLDPTLDYRQNAQRLFDKAKHAKSRAGAVGDQLARMEADLGQVETTLARLSQASTRAEIERLREASQAARWLHRPTPTSSAKEDRPYEGKRVRELIGPGGWTVLFGENAEANDYLTLRVAKPDDWWLHVRGGTSAHVIVPTRRQPDKVPREVLLFAAKVAVQNSPSKHSGYVAVDYTLRKHVRRPKGAAKGTVLYSHEKTLHVGE